MGEGVGLGAGDEESAGLSAAGEDEPAAPLAEQEVRAAAVPAASMSMKSRRCIGSIPGSVVEKRASPDWLEAPGRADHAAGPRADLIQGMPGRYFGFGRGRGG